MTVCVDREKFRAWLQPYFDAQAFPEDGSFAKPTEAIISRIMDDRATTDLPLGTGAVLREMVSEKIGRKLAYGSLHNIIWRVRLNKRGKFADG